MLIDYDRATEAVLVVNPFMDLRKWYSARPPTEAMGRAHGDYWDCVAEPTYVPGIESAVRVPFDSGEEIDGCHDTCDARTMADDTPTTEAEYLAVPVVLAAFIAWPFLHPFHSTHDTVMYWVWSAPVFICGALLLTQTVVRAVLRGVRA